MLFSDEIFDYFASESNNYYDKILKIRYDNDFKEKILEQKSYNTYPYLYVMKGISKEDILCFIGIRIFMAFINYPLLNVIGMIIYFLIILLALFLLKIIIFYYQKHFIFQKKNHLILKMLQLIMITTQGIK